MIQTSEERPPVPCVVWLEDDARIASFHEAEGFRRLEFRDHGYFLQFLQELQEAGFRFQ